MMINAQEAHFTSISSTFLCPILHLSLSHVAMYHLTQYNDTQTINHAYILHYHVVSPAHNYYSYIIHPLH